MGKKEITPSPKKRNASSKSLDETFVSPRKKRRSKLETEEMDTSEIENTTASSSINEFTDQNSNHILEKSIQLKTERNVDEYNHVSNNDAEASHSILSALSDAVDEEKSSKKKKKKKKHKELDETEMGVLDETVEPSVLDYAEQENLVENAEEIEEQPVKKKKKKKSSKKEQLDDEYTKSNQENGEVSEPEPEPKPKLKPDMQLETDPELSFLDTKQMFQDILQKLMVDQNATDKAFWAKYKFHNYSSKSCKKAFEKILTKVQKKRTLFELVNAATILMNGSPTVFSDVKVAKPATPFKLFSHGRFSKASKKHPDHRTIQVINNISKKWMKLPDQKKLKYINRALANRDEYLERVRHYKNTIDASFNYKPILTKVEWQLKDRCSGLPDAPSRSAFTLFVQKCGDIYPGLTNNDRVKKLAADFRKLPVEVKKKYKLQVDQDVSNYNKALKLYLETLTEDEREDRTYTMSYKANPVTHKAKRNVCAHHISAISEKFPKEKKPPVSGYMLFFKEINISLQHIPLIKKHVIISEKWKALSDEERSEYKRKRLVLHDEWLKKQDETVIKETAENDDDNNKVEETTESPNDNNDDEREVKQEEEEDDE